MKAVTLVQTGFVCRSCQLSRPKPGMRLYSTLLQTSPKSHRLRSDVSYEPSRKKQRRTQGLTFLTRRSAQAIASATSPRPDRPTNPLDLDAAVKWIDGQARKIISSERVPDEAAILEILVQCQETANVIVFGQPGGPTAVKENKPSHEGNPASLLLDLDEGDSGGAVRVASSDENSVAARQRTTIAICTTIYDLLRDSKVFITPKILHFYVRLQLLLGKPQYLPAIFDLYATKPIPKPGSSPITYSKTWKRSPKNAIPMELSDPALDAAIARKDLPLALAIIDTTVATPAFRFNKVLRKATVPLAAFSALPFVAWTAAEWLSNFQNTMDEGMAKGIVMTGALAYIGTISTIGFVAITSYNDQMERVTWQPGFRLRERWYREEERLYFDRVAMAWGFKEKWRRGEEQGEEWEALREFLAMRMMVLDKSSLLEGME